MDRDDFFQNIFDENSQGAEAIRAQRQLSYEERVIKRVFKECGIAVRGWGRYVNECRDMTGHPTLNFFWFNSVFRFPELCGQRIPRLHELTFADIFKPGSKNRLVRAVAKNLAKNEINSTRPFVFVFPVVRSSFCAHNLTVDGQQKPGRVAWVFEAEESGQSLTIESTASFCQWFGTGWFEGT
jgi:hypothetical protein